MASGYVHLSKLLFGTNNNEYSYVVYTSCLRVIAKTTRMNNCLSYFFFEYQAAFQVMQICLPYLLSGGAWEASSVRLSMRGTRVSWAGILLEIAIYNWVMLVVVLVAIRTIFPLPPDNDEWILVL